MSNIKDELISFETAKLAKEKGFDLKATSGMYMCMGIYEGKIGTSIDCHRYVVAPTQALLQRWLREKDVHISLDFSST